MRKGAARTVVALTKLVGRSIKAFTPADCRSYFSHAGYKAWSISSGNCSSAAGEAWAVRSVDRRLRQQVL